jgi:hypothetical protein
MVLLAACVSVSSQAVQVTGTNEEAFASVHGGTCPVTRPRGAPFIPPPPYPHDAPGDDFWHGSDDLWTSLPPDGVWQALPHNPGGYTQKLAWWRKGYMWTDEPEPDLVVTGRRLDAPARQLDASRATNAFTEEYGSMMLVGVDFPTLGCWEVNGRYGDASLRYVVWLAP